MEEIEKKGKETQFVMAILHVVKKEREEIQRMILEEENKRERNAEKLAETFTPEKKPIIKQFINT